MSKRTREANETQMQDLNTKKTKPNRSEMNLYSLRWEELHHITTFLPLRDVFHCSLNHLCHDTLTLLNDHETFWFKLFTRLWKSPSATSNMEGLDVNYMKTYCYTRYGSYQSQHKAKIKITKGKIFMYEVKEMQSELVDAEMEESNCHVVEEAPNAACYFLKLGNYEMGSDDESMLGIGLDWTVDFYCIERPICISFQIKGSSYDQYRNQGPRPTLSIKAHVKLDPQYGKYDAVNVYGDRILLIAGLEALMEGKSVFMVF